MSNFYRNKYCNSSSTSSLELTGKEYGTTASYSCATTTDYLYGTTSSYTSIADEYKHADRAYLSTTSDACSSLSFSSSMAPTSYSATTQAERKFNATTHDRLMGSTDRLLSKTEKLLSRRHKPTDKKSDQTEDDKETDKLFNPEARICFPKNIQTDGSENTLHSQIEGLLKRTERFSEQAELLNKHSDITSEELRKVAGVVSHIKEAGEGEHLGSMYSNSRIQKVRDDVSDIRVAHQVNEVLEEDLEDSAGKKLGVKERMLKANTYEKSIRPPAIAPGDLHALSQQAQKAVMSTSEVKRPTSRARSSNSTQLYEMSSESRSATPDLGQSEIEKIEFEATKRLASIMERRLAMTHSILALESGESTSIEHGSVGANLSGRKKEEGNCYGSSQSTIEKDMEDDTLSKITMFRKRYEAIKQASLDSETNAKRPASKTLPMCLNDEDFGYRYKADAKIEQIAQEADNALARRKKDRKQAPIMMTHENIITEASLVSTGMSSDKIRMVKQAAEQARLEALHGQGGNEFPLELSMFERRRPTELGFTLGYSLGDEDSHQNDVESDRSDDLDLVAIEQEASKRLKRVSDDASRQFNFLLDRSTSLFRNGEDKGPRAIARERMDRMNRWSKGGVFKMSEDESSFSTKAFSESVVDRNNLSSYLLKDLPKDNETETELQRSASWLEPRKTTREHFSISVNDEDLLKKVEEGIDDDDVDYDIDVTAKLASFSRRKALSKGFSLSLKNDDYLRYLDDGEKILIADKVAKDEERNLNAATVKVLIATPKAVEPSLQLEQEPSMFQTALQRSHAIHDSSHERRASPMTEVNTDVSFWLQWSPGDPMPRTCAFANNQIEVGSFFNSAGQVGIDNNKLKTVGSSGSLTPVTPLNPASYSLIPPDNIVAIANRTRIIRYGNVETKATVPAAPNHLGKFNVDKNTVPAFLGKTDNSRYQGFQMTLNDADYSRHLTMPDIPVNYDNRRRVENGHLVPNEEDDDFGTEMEWRRCLADGVLLKEAIELLHFRSRFPKAAYFDYSSSSGDYTPDEHDLKRAFRQGPDMYPDAIKEHLRYNHDVEFKFDDPTITASASDDNAFGDEQVQNRMMPRQDGAYDSPTVEKGWADATQERKKSIQHRKKEEGEGPEENREAQESRFGSVGDEKTQQSGQTVEEEIDELIDKLKERTDITTNGLMTTPLGSILTYEQATIDSQSIGFTQSTEFEPYQSFQTSGMEFFPNSDTSSSVHAQQYNADADSDELDIEAILQNAEQILKSKRDENEEMLRNIMANRDDNTNNSEERVVGGRQWKTSESGKDSAMISVNTINDDLCTESLGSDTGADFTSKLQIVGKGAYGGNIDTTGSDKTELKRRIKKQVKQPAPRPNTIYVDNAGGKEGKDIEDEDTGFGGVRPGSSRFIMPENKTSFAASSATEKKVDRPSTKVRKRPVVASSLSVVDNKNIADNNIIGKTTSKVDTELYTRNPLSDTASSNLSKSNALDNYRNQVKKNNSSFHDIWTCL